MKDFDELLDGVLREDAAPEPRTGLEARVLARVRAAGQQRPRWRFVTWGAVAAALPVCIVALLVWPRSAPPVQPAKEASMISGPTLPERPAARSQQNQPAKAAKAEISVRPHSARIAYQTESLPKLEVFPAPAAVDMFPQPVKRNEADRQLAALRSKKVVAALVALHQEQNEPIQIAAIKIVPIQIDKAEGRD